MAIEGLGCMHGRCSVACRIEGQVLLSPAPVTYRTSAFVNAYTSALLWAHTEYICPCSLECMSLLVCHKLVFKLWPLGHLETDSVLRHPDSFTLYKTQSIWKMYLLFLNIFKQVQGQYLKQSYFRGFNCSVVWPHVCMTPCLYDPMSVNKYFSPSTNSKAEESFICNGFNIQPFQYTTLLDKF